MWWSRLDTRARARKSSVSSGSKMGNRSSTGKSESCAAVIQIVKSSSATSLNSAMEKNGGEEFRMSCSPVTGQRRRLGQVLTCVWQQLLNFVYLTFCDCAVPCGGMGDGLTMGSRQLCGALVDRASCRVPTRRLPPSHDPLAIISD